MVSDDRRKLKSVKADGNINKDGLNHSIKWAPKLLVRISIVIVLSKVTIERDDGIDGGNRNGTAIRSIDGLGFHPASPVYDEENIWIGHLIVSLG